MWRQYRLVYIFSRLLMNIPLSHYFYRQTYRFSQVYSIQCNYPLLVTTRWINYYEMWSSCRGLFYWSILNSINEVERIEHRLRLRRTMYRPHRVCTHGLNKVQTIALTICGWILDYLSLLEDENLQCVCVCWVCSKFEPILTPFFIPSGSSHPSPTLSYSPAKLVCFPHSLISPPYPTIPFNLGTRRPCNGVCTCSLIHQFFDRW